MKLHTVWASTDGSWENAWVVDCWDEFTIDENPSGWEENLKKLKRGHKHLQVIVLITPSEQLKAVFEPNNEVNAEVQS